MIVIRKYRKTLYKHFTEGKPFCVNNFINGKTNDNSVKVGKDIRKNSFLTIGTEKDCQVIDP